MPRRPRPLKAARSEHWLRCAVNEHQHDLNKRVREVFDWQQSDSIAWLSPIESDGYAEYFDHSALDLLGLANLSTPLEKFWPRSGPRWDGLARTSTGRILLVEAKAYIEEGVDYQSSAAPISLTRIRKSLEEAKHAYRARKEARWDSPFYQYANRLAHLYYLSRVNKVDAYLLFVYFADAPDVPNPCSVAEWKGAERLTRKCLGLGNHPFRNRVGTIIWSVPEMLSRGKGSDR